MRSGALILAGLFAACGAALAQPSAPPTITGAQSGRAPHLVMPALFTDGMVLQRGKPVSIWGYGKPGERVRVSIGGQRAVTRTNSMGKWVAVLEAMSAGGPHELKVLSRGERQTLHDVLVGDVWICSGQSNMAMNLEHRPTGVLNADEEIATADFPEIRLFQVPRSTSFDPREDIADARWTTCSSDTVPPFSAVGYFFGRALHQRLDVPIGLINASYGGSPAEAWVSREALYSLPDYRLLLDIMPRLIAQSKENEGKVPRPEGRWFAQLDDYDSGYAGAQAVWTDPSLDDSDWDAMLLPGYWEDAGYPGLDGFMWFRRAVELPKEWGGKPLRLHITGVNDMHRVWFNGELIGRFDEMGGWQNPRSYLVSGRLARAGRNVITVRVYDLGNFGGFLGDADELRLESEGTRESLALSGEWRCRPGMDAREVGNKPAPPMYVEGNHRVPTVLFNAMVSPLVPYGIRGVIWYQGEANQGRAEQYCRLFPTLIEDWRSRFAQGDVPFLFVQLPNFRPRQDDPNAYSERAALREAQLKTLSLPNTGMAVTIDIGEADNNHPRNKQDVGARLALAAMTIAYGSDEPGLSPIYRAISVEGASVRLAFENARGGLVNRNAPAPLRGFAVAGSDETFHWAEARIEGEEVVVSCPKVPNPVAVRYAWGDNPEADLYNAAGLPTSPFRTDEWTFGPR